MRGGGGVVETLGLGVVWATGLVVVQAQILNRAKSSNKRGLVGNGFIQIKSKAQSKEHQDTKLSQGRCFCWLLYCQKKQQLLNKRATASGQIGIAHGYESTDKTVTNGSTDQMDCAIQVGLEHNWYR